MKSEELLEKKDLREKVVERTEVLDKVGELLLLPNTEYATTEQVAEYYKVGKEAINSLVKDNREEVESDGYKVLEGEQLKSLKDLCQIKSRARQIATFPKRAILRVGMLLRDSEVAKEIRTRLLDIVQDTEGYNPEIIQGVVQEIDEEKQLIAERVEAEMNGNFDQVCVVNAKLFALKNKRIKKLETDIHNITTNALTIIESKNVVKRIVRCIAMLPHKYNGNFGNAWNTFYRRLNYQLNINIKNRGKIKGSYLNSLNDDELKEAEKTARVWGLELGLDLDKILSIA